MIPKIEHITHYIEQLAPLTYQEDYDNAGLIIGNPKTEVTGILIALDSVESIVEEAIEKKCNLIVAHHPILFKGIKKLNGKNYVEKTLLKAIRNEIAIYASHTNLDNVQNGVNYQIAEKLGLENVRILAPKAQNLMKLTVFVPNEYTQAVLSALGDAGAGQIGAYKNCSFRTQGIGVFQPTEKANPFIGEANRLEEVKENRVEVIFPIHSKEIILQALKKAHPYEEIAYYLQTLENTNQEIGAGVIGNLSTAMNEQDFLAYLYDKMQLNCIRHTAFLQKPIQKVAICGGAGSFLLPQAIRQKADAYISADFKYHEFFDANAQILLADIGHYESEQFTSELFKNYLQTQFNQVPILITSQITNPIHYFWRK